MQDTRLKVEFPAYCFFIDLGLALIIFKMRLNQNEILYLMSQVIQFPLPTWLINFKLA